MSITTLSEAHVVARMPRDGARIDLERSFDMAQLSYHSAHQKFCYVLTHDEVRALCEMARRLGIETETQ